MNAAIKIDDLTIFRAMDNKEAFLKGLEQGATTVDLSEVGEIDTTGMQLLIALRKQAKVQGKQIEFVNAGDEIKELVMQFQLAEFLGIAV